MKRLLQWIALAALVFSITSCGLPAMLGRTATNTVNKVGSFASAAADAAY